MKIFISYRRDDSIDQVGRIYDRLEAHFGPEHIFRDVDSIALGSDFRKVIESEVARCDVFLAVIGDLWVNVTDEAGRRRLDNPADFVLLEVAAALRREILVIPVLVGRSGMPRPEQLPPSIQDLAYRNAIRVRPDPDFRRDVEALIRGINRAEGVADPGSPAHERSSLHPSAGDTRVAMEAPPRPAAPKPDERQRECIVGIDLGTTNSAISVLEGGVVTTIPNQEGNRHTPSVVAFTDKGEVLVGDAARRQAVMNSRKTISSIKRFMGRRRNELETEDKMVSCEVLGGLDDYVKVGVGDRNLVPPKVAAFVLRKLKKAAEDYRGHEIRKAVITVPASFNDAQRQATRDAGSIAGLEVVRIVSEPSAAALAYGFQQRKDEKIAVFDLGGGKFDISVLDIEEGSVVVTNTNGDTHLGGDDFDEALVNDLADAFRREHHIDLRKDPMSLQRLREAAERAKKELSTALAADINLPFIASGPGGVKHLNRTIIRAEFERLIDPLVERCRKPIEQAMKDARRTPKTIDRILLVGGSTRIPRVRKFVREFFGREPQQDLNPDEAVSIGAAVQAAILSGEEKNLLLFDVTPLSLGIETEGGVMTTLIERNATIPIERRETFSTASDNQTAVSIKVYQGERKMASANRLLGEFSLDGVPPAPRGLPQIQVTFDINIDGILNVTAKDLGTGREHKAKVQGSGGLGAGDLERMRRDVEWVSSLPFESGSS